MYLQLEGPGKKSNAVGQKKIIKYIENFNEK